MGDFFNHRAIAGSLCQLGKSSDDKGQRGKGGTGRTDDHRVSRSPRPKNKADVEQEIAEARAYRAQAETKIQEAKTHQQNNVLGGGISAVCLGLYLWIWLDEPADEQPKTTSAILNLKKD